MAPEAAGSLFDPDTFGAGGFLDDVDVEIIAASVVTGADTPMKDTDAVGQTFIKTIYKQLADDAAEDRDEYYAVGPIDKFTPSKDGSRVVYEVGTKMNKGRKAAMLMASLLNAGLNKTALPSDGSVAFLVGLKGHVNAVPMPERTQKAGGVTGDKKKENRPATCVIFTKLYDEKTAPKAGAKKQVVNGSAGAPTSAPAAAAAPQAAAAGGGEVEAETVNCVMTIIMEKGAAQKRLLPTELMQRIADVKVRTAAFKLIGDNAWLGGADRPWSFDAGSGELKLPS